MTEPIEAAELRTLARLTWNGWPDNEASRKILAESETKDDISRAAWDKVVAAILTATRPSPVLDASHNNGERLPNSDAAELGDGRPAASGDLPTSGHGYEGEFTAREFFERAFDHDKAARNGLSVGPNVSYVRTFQACAAALRYAAENMFGKDDAASGDLRERIARIVDPDAFQFHEDMIAAGLEDGMTPEASRAQADRSTAGTIPRAREKADAILASLPSRDDEAIRAEERERWQLIETAPRDGTPFLAWEGEECGPFKCWMHQGFSTDEYYWMDYADSEPNPTHWMPLMSGPCSLKTESGS